MRHGTIATVMANKAVEAFYTATINPPAEMVCAKVPHCEDSHIEDTKSSFDPVQEMSNQLPVMIAMMSSI